MWADCNRRVYQEVAAHSPEEAYRLAKESPGGWAFCAEHEDNGYVLSDDVQDVETGEYTTVGGVEHCTTCGSEIVATVNDSVFRDGECGGCEYLRYRTQPALLDAAHHAHAVLTERSHRRHARATPERLRLAAFTVDRLASALNAYADAA